MLPFYILFHRCTDRSKHIIHLIEETNSKLLFLAKKNNLPKLTANCCFFPIAPKLPLAGTELPLTGPKLPSIVSKLPLMLMAI